MKYLERFGKIKKYVLLCRSINSKNESMNIQKLEFNDELIEFDIRQGKNMMVNATEMAKQFGKDVPDFLILNQTKNFIDECLKNQNSGFLGIENREDLVSGKQKSGTWMHRVLALKFAAWLNPAFELWVYMTIDRLLYAYAIEIEDSISETVRLQRDADSLKNQLAKESPEFMKLLSIEQKINFSKNRRREATKNKFRELNNNLFTNNN